MEGNADHDSLAAVEGDSVGTRVVSEAAAINKSFVSTLLLVFVLARVNALYTIQKLELSARALVQVSARMTSSFLG